MNQQPRITGVSHVVESIDAHGRLKGRTALLWYLVLGGLFLDAYSNAALGAGLVPMSEEMGLTPSQVGILTACAPAIALVVNPLAGWASTRYGRLPLLILAKALALVGSLLACTAGGFEMVLVGRVFVGIAYGTDFAVAMAMLGEITPKALKSRLNYWQSIWYVATTLNLGLALAFYTAGVGVGSIWRWSMGSAAVFAAILLVLQVAMLPESPCWLATKGRFDASCRSLRRFYGIEASPGTPGEEEIDETEPEVGFAQAGQLFRGAYLPRTILSTVISICQAMQYFAIGWYLPVISLGLFGEDFRQATFGSMVFNACGIVGGALSAYFGRRLGLRMSSAFGFGAVFVILLTMGLTFGRLPIGVAALLPALFIFCHSAGPGANGKSVAALAYRSSMRTLGTGVTGMLGSLGSVVGLYIFPVIKESLGLGPSIAVLSVVPLVGLITCLLIAYEPLRMTVSPDEEYRLELAGLDGTHPTAKADAP